MTRDVLLGYVGKRVTVCWASNVGGGAYTGVLDEISTSGYAWFDLESATIPIRWITSIALAEPDGARREG